MKTLDIQKRLKELGFEPGPLDGTPGRQTSAAVSAFQRSKKLMEDGIVGPATLAALFPDKPTGTLVKSNLPGLDIADVRRDCTNVKTVRSCRRLLSVRVTSMRFGLSN